MIYLSLYDYQTYHRLVFIILLVFYFVYRPQWPFSKNRGYDDTLYPVKIISEATDPAKEGDVQIYYVGYSDAYDEWSPCDDIVNFVSSNFEVFCLHNKLALCVKSSLVIQRRSNLAV